MKDMNDEERIECCQREIQRLRNVIRLYETQRNDFYQWLQTEKMKSDGKQPEFNEVYRQFEELFDYYE